MLSLCASKNGVVVALMLETRPSCRLAQSRNRRYFYRTGPGIPLFILNRCPRIFPAMTGSRSLRFIKVDQNALTSTASMEFTYAMRRKCGNPYRNMDKLTFAQYHAGGVRQEFAECMVLYVRDGSVMHTCQIGRLAITIASELMLYIGSNASDGHLRRLQYGCRLTT
jgi:hypothetical protein